MNAGLLRDRLIFEKRILTYVNELRYERWSAEDDDDGFEAFGEVQQQSETVCRFIVRYRAGVRPNTYRIIWNDVIWRITSAVYDRKNTMITIDADFTEALEVTHQQSEDREYIDGLPIVRTPST
jgi:hypothetical protein